MKHPHAELMLEYAKDAMESENPWLNWQTAEACNGIWVDLLTHPYWSLGYFYRRKPKPYVPTLLDQALELEIEAAKLRMKAAIPYLTAQGKKSWEHHIERLEFDRSPAMIEHLKSQGKL